MVAVLVFLIGVLVGLAGVGFLGGSGSAEDRDIVANRLLGLFLIFAAVNQFVAAWGLC